MKYTRTCFAFALLEALPVLYRLIGLFSVRPLISIVYFALYGLILFSAFRMLFKKHVPSAKGLMFLRVGIIVAITVQFLLKSPIPPMSILLVQQLVHIFQLYLATCAVRELSGKTAIYREN